MGLDLDAFLADVIVNECKLRKRRLRPKRYRPN